MDQLAELRALLEDWVAPWGDRPSIVYTPPPVVEPSVVIPPFNYTSPEVGPTPPDIVDILEDWVAPWGDRPSIVYIPPEDQPTPPDIVDILEDWVAPWGDRPSINYIPEPVDTATIIPPPVFIPPVDLPPVVLPPVFISPVVTPPVAGPRPEPPPLGLTGGLVPLGLVALLVLGRKT